MRKYKPGQFFYIVNRTYRNNRYVEENDVPLLIEIISSKKKKTKKKKQPLSFAVLYTLKVHIGRRMKKKIYVKGFYEWGVGKIKGPNYIRHSQLTSYMNNNAIEPLSMTEATKILLVGSDEFYQSPAYDRLVAKELLEGGK